MDLGLKGKKALITGASKGLGYEAALAFAREGAMVGIIARSNKALEKILKEMGGKAAGHAYAVSDLTKPGAVERAVQKIEDEMEGFDIVIHNVGGVTEPSDPLSPIEDWQKSWDLNIGIAIRVNNILVPKMRDKKWGRIIHVSSISGEHLLGNPLYTIAKASLIDYSTVLARKVAKDGIVVSAVLPGAFRHSGNYWDTMPTSDPDHFDDIVKNHLSIGRVGETKEIVPFILLLASNHASFAVGTRINIDGGTV